MKTLYIFNVFFIITIVSNNNIVEIESFLKKLSPDLSLEFAIKENKIMQISRDLSSSIQSKDWDKAEASIKELEPLYKELALRSDFLSDSKDKIKSLSEYLDSVNSNISKLKTDLEGLSDLIDSKREHLISAIKSANSSSVVENSITLDIEDIKDLLNDHGSKKIKLDSEIENLQEALTDSGLDFTQDELQKLRSILKQKKIDQNRLTRIVDDILVEFAEKMNLRSNIESERLSQKIEIDKLTSEIEEHQKDIEAKKLKLKALTDLKDSIIDSQDFLKRLNDLKLLYKDFEFVKKELLQSQRPAVQKVLEGEGVEIKQVVDRLPRVLDFKLSDSSGIKDIIERSPVQGRSVDFEIKTPKLRQPNQPSKDMYQGFRALLKGVQSEPYQHDISQMQKVQRSGSSYITADQKGFGPLRSNELAEATDRTIWDMPARVL